MFLFLPIIRDNSDPSSQYLVKPRNPRAQKPGTPCDQNLVKYLCSIVNPPRLKWYWVKRKLVNRQVVAKCLMKTTSSLKMSERYHVTPRRPYWCKKTAAMFKENRLHWEFTRISYSVVRFTIILFLLPQFLLTTKVIFTLRLAFSSWAFLISTELLFLLRWWPQFHFNEFQRKSASESVPPDSSFIFFISQVFTV